MARYVALPLSRDRDRSDASGLIATLVMLFFCGCVVNPIDLDGRDCPCTAGWVCDTRTNLCVRVLPIDAGAGDAAMNDAAMNDAAIDDAATADAAIPDALTEDAAVPDAQVPDAPTPDAAADARPPQDADVCALGLVINELMTRPVQDWDDSTGGGDGTAFNSVPGAGGASNDDQWIELYNPGCAVDLTGYKLHMEDGSPNVHEFGVTATHPEIFSAGGSITNFQAGEYLVIGNPGESVTSSQMTPANLYVHLEDPFANLLDDMAIGSSSGGDGDSTNNAPTTTVNPPVSAESVARIPNGADTNWDISDWFVTFASIGADNF